MEETSYLTLEHVQAELTKSGHPAWRKVLETLTIVGVADSAQLEPVTGLTHMQWERLLDQFCKLSEALVKKWPTPLARPGGRRGRPPSVYLLGDDGAALLRKMGCPEARPCGLNQPTPLLHALAMLDVHLKAQADGAPMATDQVLAYGAGRVLRPDHRVTLPSGERVLIEIEQLANHGNLQRILESLQHKVAFFQSKESQGYSRDVRMVVQLPRGKVWAQTLKQWETATQAVADEHGGNLPFRLLALPLGEFLAAPEWAAPPDTQRWDVVFDPAVQAKLQAAQAMPVLAVATSPETASGAKTAAPPQSKKKDLPNPLQRYTSRESQLLLKVYWKQFQAQAGKTGTRGALPDLAFFDVMELIYSASHAHPPHPLAVPYASLYLLQEYLKFHPQLRLALDKALTRSNGNIKVSPTLIMHRAQLVVDLFLRYHHVHSDGPALKAYPELPSWEAPGSRAVEMCVWLQPEGLLPVGGGVVPNSDYVAWMAEALAWVLSAFFKYPTELGLKQAVCW